MNKTSLYLAFILVLLSAIVYFGDAPERILGTSTALKNEVNAVPFAVARNTATTHYERDGRLSYTFNARRLEHYREQQGSAADVFTLVDKPELVIYQDREPWFVQAEKGKLTSRDQNIELWSQVLVKHTNEEGITTTINTERLQIDPVAKVANTTEPVRIRSNKIEMNGTGMDADLVQEKVKLRSNVRGLYDPT